MRPKSDTVLYAVDLAGTFVFAIEGALAAARGNLDFFGLIVLAFVTAVGGGIIRDLLIGSVPPGAIKDWRYAVLAFVAANTVFFLYGLVQQIPPTPLMVIDAAGLALFAVSGAGKALSYGIHPFLAVLMGGITGVGGGTVRDILLARVPAVLRTDIYAVAAIAGAAVMITGIKFKLRAGPMMVLGGVVCFALRVVSVMRHWNLPSMSVH